MLTLSINSPIPVCRSNVVGAALIKASAAVTPERRFLISWSSSIVMIGGIIKGHNASQSYSWISKQSNAFQIRHTDIHEGRLHTTSADRRSQVDLSMVGALSGKWHPRHQPVGGVFGPSPY